MYLAGGRLIVIFLNKALKGEVPPRGPISYPPYPYTVPFLTGEVSFSYTRHKKGTALTYHGTITSTTSILKV